MNTDIYKFDKTKHQIEAHIFGQVKKFYKRNLVYFQIKNSTPIETKEHLISYQRAASYYMEKMVAEIINAVEVTYGRKTNAFIATALNKADVDGLQLAVLYIDESVKNNNKIINVSINTILKNSKENLSHFKVVKEINVSYRTRDGKVAEKNIYRLEVDLNVVV